jgi:hypothetical protein
MEVLTQYLAKDVLGIAVVDLVSKTKQKPDKSKETAANAVDEIPDDQLEDELLKELKDAGY